MNFQSIEYVIALRPDNSNILRVRSDGSASALIQFGGGVNDSEDIGTFESKLTADEMGNLSLLVGDPSFKDAKDDTGRLLPGASFRQVVVTGPSGKVEKVAQWENEPASPVSRVYDALDGVLSKVRNSPRQVVRVQLSSASVDANGNASAVLTLTNVGRQALRVHSPLPEKDRPATNLQMEAWPDRPDVQASDVVIAPARVEKARDSAVGVIDLAPHTSQSYRVEAHPHWRSPGAYQLRVRLFSPATSGHPGEISGEVYTRPVRISVP